MYNFTFNFETDRLTGPGMLGVKVSNDIEIVEFFSETHFLWKILSCKNLLKNFVRTEPIY